MKKLLLLTGDIAAGKSTFSNMLNEQNGVQNAWQFTPYLFIVFISSLWQSSYFSFPCFNILTEYKLKYRPHKRLNEEQLCKECKREIKAY